MLSILCPCEFLICFAIFVVRGREQEDMSENLCKVMYMGVSDLVAVTDWDVRI